MRKDLKGIKRAAGMRRWAYRKGGFDAEPDGFDRSTPNTMASLVDAWLLRMLELGYSPRSVAMRRWSMRPFLRWAQDHDLRCPAPITRHTLEDYQRWLYCYRTPLDKPLGVTTQRGILGSLRLFFGWLCKSNRLPANPASDLELPRKPHRPLPKALTRHEINTVLSVPDIGDPLGIRDRAILEAFYATGIRRTELTRLDMEDFDESRGVITIRRGKGGKDRVVPAGERAAHWIRRYLDEMRPLLETASGDKALFLTGYGERFSQGSLGNRVGEIIAAAKIGKTGNCHLFRHSCATHMLENGADIRFIQQLLGHARLDTTQIYTEVSILQLKEVHARTHPAGQMSPTGTEECNSRRNVFSYCSHLF